MLVSSICILVFKFVLELINASIKWFQAIGHCFTLIHN